MSSLLFCQTRSQPHAEAAGDRLCFAPTTWKQRFNLEDGIKVVTTRVDDPSLWEPAYDKASGVRVWLGGRVAFEETDWARAESLPYEGGLACRLLIEMWHRHGDGMPRHANGAFGIVVYDGKRRQLHVFTDAMGIYPIYTGKSGSLVLCTHPDVLADYMADQEDPCNFDLDTLAEVLAMGSSVQPHTFYREVKQLEPASHYRWNLNRMSEGFSRTTWWNPARREKAVYSCDQEAVHDLADALARAVRRRTLPRLGKCLVMLSGGADSRLALFGADAPSRLTAMTLCDESNAEVETAEKLAKLAGAAHSIYQRDLEYYPKVLEAAMTVSGGMWNVVDAHFMGIQQELNDQDFGVILTGCYADYMFKGLSLNRKHRKLFGKVVPLFDLSDFDFQFYHPQSKVSSDCMRGVQRRLEERFPSELRETYRDTPLLMEDLRTRPLSREADAAGRLCLMRTQAWDVVFSDRDVLDVYEKLSVEQKLNGILFGKAVGRVCGPAARKIPNNNYQTPVDAGEIRRLYRFLVGVAKRKVGRFAGKAGLKLGQSTPGSWPNWPYIVEHSETIRSMWDDMPSEHQDLFSDVLGFNVASKSLKEWAEYDHMQLCRILSHSAWLRTRGME